MATIMEKSFKLEVGFEELRLIEKALELYGRVGMLQFDKLTLCDSLQKLIWEKEVSSEFQDRSDKLKELFGYTRNSGPGIFNKEVGDDCRVAIDIYQTIRHQRYIERKKDNAIEDFGYSVDQNPADICQIAGLKTPKFNFVSSNQ